jgi:hypothetical protein
VSTTISSLGRGDPAPRGGLPDVAVDGDRIARREVSGADEIDGRGLVLASVDRHTHLDANQLGSVPHAVLVRRVHRRDCAQGCAVSAFTPEQRST